MTGYCRFRLTDVQIISAYFTDSPYIDDDVEPDTRDIEITSKISKAAKLLGINLLDHVIISATSYYSIADHQAYALTPEQLNILQEG